MTNVKIDNETNVIDEMIYYYAPIKNIYQTEFTYSIDEFVTLLFNGEGEFISDGQRIELKLEPDYLQILKILISSYEEKVPLYDIYFNHIHLIHKENVYHRIFYDNYRFVEDYFYSDLLKLKNKTEADKENLRILSHYDLVVLKRTYLKIFYDSFVIESYITSCQRPSFKSGMAHINPYYNINELYYLAYDWDLIKESNRSNETTLSEEQVNKLCKKISKYDISAQTLLDHQIYIYDSKAIGLVKHYSLFGSYFMNRFLRGHKCCLQEVPDHENKKTGIRNPTLENQIKLMIKLIKNAPGFTKSHTVYRFIETDQYLKHLKEGDTYYDPSFISTTRNPFYYQENYQFGYILIKIKLPENIKGVGLCIEAYSNFPNEEEIVLIPTTKLRLDRITEEKGIDMYQHILNKKVKKKYEFTWVSNDYLNSDSVTINIPNAIEPEINVIDFRSLLGDDNITYTSIADRLRYFTKNYVNINYQFISKILDREYTFILQSYNSTSVYEEFFYYTTATGLLLYSSNPRYGNINIFLELGPEIHVNFYFKFSVNDSNQQLNLNQSEWIEWLSLLAYVIGSRTVIIHSNYILSYDKSDTIEEKQIKTRYVFSQNVYQYLKNGVKYFDSFGDVISPNFDYFMLDWLSNVSIDDALKSTDKDELYRIAKDSHTTNMKDFYIYIVENNPRFIQPLEEKLDFVYEMYQVGVNPFPRISYTLKAWEYLYNRELIRALPSDKEFSIVKGSFKTLIGDKKIPQFKNRLRYYLLNKKTVIEKSK